MSTAKNNKVLEYSMVDVHEYECTYEDNGHNCKDHDCLTLSGRSCSLLSREAGFKDTCILLFQVEQRIYL